MSLINDMLKDIDRDASAGEAPLPAGLVERKPDKPAAWRRYLLPSVALLALIYALLVEWNLLGLMPDKHAATTEIPQPIAINPKWLNQPSPALLAEPAPADSAAQLTSVQTMMITEQAGEPAQSIPPAEPLAEAEAHASAVDQLLAAAEQALTANRLTTPAGDNAYQFYNSVLVIDPANTAAHAGIEFIRQRYLQWLDQALVENRLPAARLYWQKAKAVGVDSARLTSYQTVLMDKTRVANQTNLRETPASAHSAEASAPQSAAKITPAILPNDAHMAERLRSEGLRREQEAQRLLARAPNALQTAVALTDLYVERRAIGDLRHLLDTLSNQPARPYVLAQLLVLEGQEPQARETLATAEFSGLAERQRLRLLAGLQQKAGHYAAALELYATLISASPDNVGDWLGLAVSADKEKLTGTALNAYEKVLLLRHPDPRVMRYARQRQQDLSYAAINSR